MVAQAKAKYSTGTFHGGADGEEFELLSFHCFKFSGIQFIAESLSEDVSDLTITFPEKEILMLDWRTKASYLKENVLYIPPYGNMESGDAFCVISVEGKKTLCILQCTIAEKHDVNQNGMVTIYDSFVSNSHVKIENTIILFIIPKNGKLIEKQKIIIQKGEEVKRFNPKILSTINQQYKIENSLVRFDDEDETYGTICYNHS